MNTYSAKDICNVAIAGHNGKGKTTLAEAMLFVAKATDRMGRVADGNTVFDFDPEEKKKKSTLTASLASVEWKNKKINILDTPGFLDFAGSLAEASRAVETIITVISSGGSLHVGCEKAEEAAIARGLARYYAITNNDSDKADFLKSFNLIRDKFGNKICPVVVPVIEGTAVTGYVDFSKNKAFKYDNGVRSEIPVPEADYITELRSNFEEAIASADEELMEKFFEGTPLTQEETERGLQEAVTAGEIFPVFACSGYTADAVDLLLDGLVNAAPYAKHADGIDLEVNEDGPVAAICFKTVDDRFGKMSFFKVISGKITPDTPAYNPRTSETSKIGKMVLLKGEKQEETKLAKAGDIVVILKLDDFKTGDTLCSSKNEIELKGINYPKPNLSYAVRAKKKGEEDKIATGLNRIAGEDPTVKFATNVETHEQVLSVIGEQHLDYVINKLKNKFNVEVELSAPKVAYRETISAKYDAHGRHKKQSGGSGQFGDVWIRFEPMEGEGFEFLDEVVGGAVPRNFIPSVEKGLRNAIEKGPLTGSKVVGIRAALHDGQSHPVDSNDMAFQTAARLAFKEAMQNAKPKILEPYGILKATMKDEKLGDIMGDVTKRRGRVLGMGPCETNPNLQELTAEVPMAEMGDFATVFRSVTVGRGSYEITFDHYETAPNDVAQKVIDAAKAEADED